MATPTYTPADQSRLFTEICYLLGKGIPLAEICRTDGLPCQDTVREWIRQDKSLEPMYLQAREDGFDAIAADALKIIDTPMPGRVQKRERQIVPLTPEQEALPAEERAKLERTYEMVVVEERVEDMIAHRRLQFDGRLKLLSKWSKRYSDKLELAGDDASPLTIVVRKLTDAGD